MQKQVFNSSVLSAVLLFASLLTSPLSFAQCCPNTGGGAPKATNGLGQSFPQATDLAADPEWQVYEFERGGLRYLQINDSSGKVRAAIGRVDDVFWVMPIGADADRVTIDGEEVMSDQRKVVYRAADVEVVLHRTTTGDHWEVRQPEATH